MSLAGAIRRWRSEPASSSAAPAKDYERQWVRPAADPAETVETFAPTVARFIRLVVEGRKDNPDLTTAFGIDEFEVWTADPAPRNVPLAANGGQADAASRAANDFADAYSAKLAIDGQFAAVWIAGGPELTIKLARPERIGRIVFSNNRGLDTSTKFFRIPFVGDYRVKVSEDGAAWTEVASAHDRQPASPAWRRKRLLELEATAEERSQLATLTAEVNRAGEQLAAVPPLPSWWVGVFRKAPGPFTIALAGQVHAYGWRLKPLHRLIVTSAAYRQASTLRPDAARDDASSRYLWRFPPRRLAAEEVRDTMLSLAGQLDRRMGGPGYRLYRYLEDNVATYVPLDAHGPETYRRAVYHQNARRKTC
jgi:hypothetical protein